MAAIISITTVILLMRDIDQFLIGPVNPSSSTFGNINLSEVMTNLIVVWKFN